MAGTMSGLLTWTTLLAASFLVGQLPSLEGVEAESVICRTREGWTVQRRFLLLAEEQFQEAELRRVFGEYLREPGAGELYVLASSDLQFFRAKSVLHRDVGVYLTEAPVAYFFRIGGNAFFPVRTDWGVRSSGWCSRGRMCCAGGSGGPSCGGSAI